MKPIRATITIAASPAQIWDYVKEIDSHTEWMHDAVAITFTTDQTSGVGTTFDCLTKVGPIKLIDRMNITQWIPEQAMGVRHVGIVTGEGVFELKAVGPDRTLFSWTESLHFPALLGGRVGAAIARPILSAIWNRNLKLLRAKVETVPTSATKKD